MYKYFSSLPFFWEIKVPKKGFICTFNIANPSICFFLLIQSSAAVVTTLSQLSKVTCTWAGVAQWDSQAYMCLDCRRKAEGERREPPSLQALTIQLWIDEILDLFVKSKKLSLPPVWSEMFLLCESHYRARERLPASQRNKYNKYKQINAGS